MKELLLKQLQVYSQNINSIEMELIELENIILEKKTVLEQNRGAYNAIFSIAIDQNVITPDGKIIEESKKETI